MNYSIANLGKICLVISLWISADSIDIAPSMAESRQSTLIFECVRDPQSKIYSTVIKYPVDKTNELIRWKSKLVSNPKQTCREVSDKFQAAWSSGKLNYLKTGKSTTTGRAIICGLADRVTLCNDAAKLFDLVPGTNRRTAFVALLQKINLKNNSIDPIFQGSDDELIIDLRDSIEQLRSST
jgi:Circadian oscillating protein COP23